jgi:hypothetical protein
MIKLLLPLLLSLNLLAESLSDYIGSTEAVANEMDAIELSVYELNYMYLGKLTHWSDGSEVTILVRDLDSYTQKNFIVSMLGVSIARYKEIIASTKSIKTISNKVLVPEMIKHQGTLTIISSDELYLCTENGLVKVEIIE